jgi:hypothetical protein
MKTHPTSNRFILRVRGPEIVIWVIALLVFISLLYRADLKGQDNQLYLSDTLWLKTGEVIPCIVINDVLTSHEVLVLHLDKDSTIMQKEFPLTELQKFRIQSTRVEKKEAMRTAFPPKTLRMFGTVGVGYPKTFGLSFNVLLKNDLGFGVSYRLRSIKSENQPSDYRSGLFLVPAAEDQTEMLSFYFTKAFSSALRQSFRLGLEAGPAWVTYKEAKFTSSSSFLGPNYQSKYETSSTIGASFCLKLEFPVTRVFGFQVSGFGNLNTVNSCGSVEFALVFGKIRD